MALLLSEMILLFSSHPCQPDLDLHVCDINLRIVPVFKFGGLMVPFGDWVRRFCFSAGVLLVGLLSLVRPTGLEIWFNRGLVISLDGGVHKGRFASGLVEGEELGVLS